MTLFTLAIILLAQVGLVAGQIFLKHGMNAANHPGKPAATVARNVALGIAMLTLWFLLWMGLLQKLDLSYVYPFEGISPVLLVIAAWFMLKERLSARAWIGVVTIAVGTALVGMS
jgi:undecaprenyl phosphate-alpha-L-ara4N flippase subunit ArnE